MAKGVYVGVSNKARKVTDIYIGVSNKARRVTKAYIGIGGVARLFYSAHKGPALYTTIALTAPRQAAVAVAPTNISFAMILGGHHYTGLTTTPLSTINVITDSLTVSDTASGLKVATTGASGGWVKQNSTSGIILYAGGVDAANTYPKSVSCFGYGASYGSVQDLRLGRAELSCASTDSKILFAGGRNSSGQISLVEAYDSTGTQLSFQGFLTVPVSDGVGVSIKHPTNGQYAVFGGGWNGSNSTSYGYVDVFNDSLTKISCSSLTTARHSFAGAASDDYIVFGGGRSSTSNSERYSTVDVYTSSLTKLSGISNLSKARHSLAATSVDSYIMFGGGTYGISNIIDIYDAQLVRSTPCTLSTARHDLAAFSFSTKKYALFAGGYGYLNNVNESLTMDTVDVLNIIE